MDTRDSIIEDDKCNIHLNLSIQRCKNNIVIMSVSVLPILRKSHNERLGYWVICGREVGSYENYVAIFYTFLSKIFSNLPDKRGSNRHGWEWMECHRG